MSIEAITIIVYIIAGVVWVLSMLRCLAYLRLGRKVSQMRSAPTPEGELPGISVIVTAHNQVNELRMNLPLILSQIYPRFEVIVVDTNSNDNTKDLLEKMEEDNINLRHTFTPPTSRDISTQRLAITLGIKASTYPWVVITQADCSPISHQWLRRLGDSIVGHRSAEMVVGYTRYAKTANITKRSIRFHRLWHQMMSLTYALKHGAYCCDGTNLAYKKELFLSHQGFASHSTLLTGATDIMVNHHSTKHNTAVCLHPESFVEQQNIKRRRWRQDRLFFQETRRHFHSSWLYRMRYAATVMLHALLIISMIATSVLSIYNKEYIGAGVAAVLLIVHFIMQGFCFNVTARALNNQPTNYVSIAWFIHLIPIWFAASWLHYQFSDKRQYRKKYI